ncbi:MAG: hypothetical protein WCO84_04480 [bacterium]
MEQPTQFSQNIIEAEIAELTKRIQEKRKVLEEQNGIIEEKDLIRSAVAEGISSSPSSQTSSSSQKTTVTTKSTEQKTDISYIDTIDPKTGEEVNRLIEIAFTKGIEAAFSEVSKDEPYVVDAFHDVLVDRLYEDLKNRGIVK